MGGPELLLSPRAARVTLVTFQAPQFIPTWFLILRIYFPSFYPYHYITQLLRQNSPHWYNFVPTFSFIHIYEWALSSHSWFCNVPQPFFFTGPYISLLRAQYLPLLLIIFFFTFFTVSYLTLSFFFLIIFFYLHLCICL